MECNARAGGLPSRWIRLTGNYFYSVAIINEVQGLVGGMVWEGTTGNEYINRMKVCSMCL